MANNYDFMFKFIIIGDSSQSYFIKVLANHAFFSGLLRLASSQIINQLWAFNLALGMLTSRS